MESIGRRAFLRVTGLSATAAAVSACAIQQPSERRAVTTTTTSTPRAATTAPPPAPVPSTTGPAPIDYRALAGKLSGHLVQPGQPGYDTARRSYNPLYDGRQPAAVAQCAGLGDVQACVEAAAAARVPIAARSGGHSYTGYSTPDNALVVDLVGLSGVRVDPDGTAVIGAGARLIDVYTALAAAGRAVPAGSCPSVGIAGLTLGGGIGVLARKFGLTCDHLTGATVVTADGQARTVCATTDPDLFWALRGGGGGNFGIVTSFTFTTVPAPPVLTVFLLGFSAGSMVDAYAGWQSWIAAAPDELWSNFNITGGNPSTATVVGCFVGPATALNPLLANLITRTGRQPTFRNVMSYGYLDAMRYFAGVAKNHGTSGNREASVASSRMVSAPLSDPYALVTSADGHPDLHLIIDSLGGAVGRIAPADTAFPHRGALASVQIYLKTMPGARESASTQVAAVRDRLTGVLGESAYINYLDGTMPNWAHAYYGANLPRLRQVATQYDPNSVFTFPQAINRA